MVKKWHLVAAKATHGAWVVQLGAKLPRQYAKFRLIPRTEIAHPQISGNGTSRTEAQYVASHVPRRNRKMPSKAHIRRPFDD
jgi:hypothetical protein